MSYFIVAFHPSWSVEKRFIKNDGQIINLIKEGFTVYRPGTDQIAQIFNSYKVTWFDVKENEEGVSK